MQMDVKTFNNLVDERIENCRKTLVLKGEEYSREGDRLWNFKSAARHRKTTPEDALMGMRVKHDVSIEDIVAGLAQGKIPSRETVHEKIGDEINYMLLLEGLIEERREQQLVFPPNHGKVVEVSGYSADSITTLSDLVRRS
jgi:hypothetical protein